MSHSAVSHAQFQVFLSQHGLGPSERRDMEDRSAIGVMGDVNRHLRGAEKAQESADLIINGMAEAGQEIPGASGMNAAAKSFREQGDKAWDATNDAMDWRDAQSFERSEGGVVPRQRSSSGKETGDVGFGHVVSNLNQASRMRNAAVRMTGMVSRRITGALGE